MKIIKIIVPIIVILLLCGCSNKECVKFHKEEGTCIRTVCTYTGKVMVCPSIPYKCNKTICDEYEEVKKDEIQDEW